MDEISVPQLTTCNNISDVLCFCSETHPRNLDIRKHAETTNNVTTPPNTTSSSGPHHERVVGPRCTAVASCSIGGRDPSSVITTSFFCCAVHVCAVCRASRAPRQVRTWIFGNMVKWSRCPILDLMVSVRASQSSRYFFFQRFFSTFIFVLY